MIQIRKFYDTDSYPPSFGGSRNTGETNFPITIGVVLPKTEIKIVGYTKIPESLIGGSLEEKRNEIMRKWIYQSPHVLLNEAALQAMDEYATLVSAPLQERIRVLEEFLKSHEQWEADFISDNKQWWPSVEKDTLRGMVYEGFLELQKKRNQLFKK